MVGEHLSIVGAKDVLIEREEREGHGSARLQWVPAGRGVVDWTAVFETLRDIAFGGPLTVHCEFEIPEAEFMDTFAAEIDFFKRLRDGQEVRSG